MSEYEELKAAKPYNPTGDAISRELLKKDIEDQISDFSELNKKGEPYKEFKDIRAILFGLFIGKNLIDYAPAIPEYINEDAKKHFKGKCPYTDKKCEDWRCQDCEVEAAERKYMENDSEE